MLNLILFGPPGSGKGTQALKLAEHYHLVHISTGDLFRYEMGNNTPLGIEAKQYMAKGELVPDAITIGMLRNKVESCPDAAGFIFDGFPRTINQAKALDKFLKEKGTAISKLIELEVGDEEIVKRILLRGAASSRSDDNDKEVILNRIDVYRRETAPVFDYYAQFGKSAKLTGTGDIQEIYKNLRFILDEILI
jgi:adenylate kinase